MWPFVEREKCVILSPNTVQNPPACLLQWSPVSSVMETVVRSSCTELVIIIPVRFWLQQNPSVYGVMFLVQFVCSYCAWVWDCVEACVSSHLIINNKKHTLWQTINKPHYFWVTWSFILCSCTLTHTPTYCPTCGHVRNLLSCFTSNCIFELLSGLTCLSTDKSEVSQTVLRDKQYIIASGLFMEFVDNRKATESSLCFPLCTPLHWTSSPSPSCISAV